MDFGMTDYVLISLLAVMLAALAFRGVEDLRSRGRR